MDPGLTFLEVHPAERFIDVMAISSRPPGINSPERIRGLQVPFAAVEFSVFV